MGARIDTVTARSKLPSRRDPYWQRVSRGLFVGFRKMTNDTIGTWVVRYRAADGVQLRQNLGSLEQVPASDRFDKAAEEAQKWLNHINLGGTIESSTVMDACDCYTRRVRELKGDKPADDLEARYRRWVSHDPIRQIEITKLTREQVNAFRQRMVAAPVKVGRSGETRPRSKASVNRDMAAIRAALNLALEDGKTTSNFAWKKPLAAFKNVSKRRDLYLDRDQRRQLIQSAEPDLARFIRGLSMLPLRPGALAALTVADLDIRIGVLKIGKDKSGKDRRLKLPQAIATFLMEAVQDRPPTAPLLARQDGLAWNKDAWKKPLKVAAAAAQLPAGTIAYALRHSAISDLVHGGLDLLTVAQISGTSVAMIERHYGHLRGEVAASALSKLIL
ncbi:site-specific recombinase XerD [Janthinobacterium sp. HH01]|uniref:tyrosine-type recombinase/integrase n=1 Tax=Janthinobacterium sp. HH01 TaxID=1198452 RepID=UPI0002AEA429|nr:tyrosine-type recombinase/integrase [Janthinobacterium sp. HH01]ELX08439.1 site-specific recombinase XerD [Janthinobacterium sp. HH01]